MDLFHAYFESLERPINMKKLYFELGAFLMPTYAINSMSINTDQIIKKLRFNKKGIALLK